MCESSKIQESWNPSNFCAEKVCLPKFYRFDLTYFIASLIGTINRKILKSGMILKTFTHLEVSSWLYGSCTFSRFQCLDITEVSFDTDGKHSHTSMFEYDCNVHITKTYLYNFDPLKLHFYIVKLGFTGVYIDFLISGQKHRLWVLVRTASSRRF